LKKPDLGGDKLENTKETILYQALTLFSDRGYEGVTMRDIAGAVGIKAASLYNHFKNKEDIFNSIIDEMSKRYEEAVLRMQVPHGDMAIVVEKYMNVTENTLVAISKGIFLYFLKDDFASKFRRMLTIEQFRSSQAGAVFQSFFIDGVLNFQNSLFENMMKQSGFIECDPYVMALHFYSPMFLLLSKYDRLPGKEEEALEILVKHVKQFSTIYQCTSSKRYLSKELLNDEKE
jgi:TetR/AcrR family transcriptional regulator, biofilm operon repressor